MMLIIFILRIYINLFIVIASVLFNNYIYTCYNDWNYVKRYILWKKRRIKNNKSRILCKQHKKKFWIFHFYFSLWCLLMSFNFFRLFMDVKVLFRRLFESILMFCVFLRNKVKYNAWNQISQTCSQQVRYLKCLNIF